MTDHHQLIDAKRTRRYLRITREGWSYIFILSFVVIGSILQQINLLIVLAGLMIAPLLFNWRIAMNSIFKLQFRRILPAWAHAGQRVAVEWEVLNTRTLLPAWGIKCTDSIRRKGIPPRKATSVDAIIAQILPQKSQFASFTCHFGQRGIYFFEGAKISSKFPLGLVNAWYYDRKPVEFFVAPRLGVLTEVWHRKLDASAVGIRSKSRRVGINNDEFFGLRPWQSGDSRRHIHWRSTAKQGELIVKQFDQQTDRDFALVLDLWQSDVSTPSDIEISELAISFTATVISTLRQKIRGNVAIGLCGKTAALHIDRVNHEFAANALRDLADIQPASENQFSQLVLAMEQATTGSAPLIVISTRSREAVLAELDANIAPSGEFTIDCIRRADWITANTPEFNELFTLQFHEPNQKVEVHSYIATA
ncbi:MAG TPA: DUF58 domain-containing protein [Pirellulaceae bacterium]|nr:DUF58 domain-containing protein [Pirellulaceae bacterium]HMO92097.1 DUF58 domain-containing protein [Pirellulaceae bacterium]HMP69315.1 DUF58 domain-containing protein [Pirellulaceae bacterium]